MEKERIELVYKIIINGLVLNDHTLTNYGFTEEEIETFLVRRIIEPNKNNTYKLVSVEKLRQYGVKLLLTGAARSANECFRICYKLAPNGKNICLQYLLATVVRQDYKTAFDIFANLEKIQPEKNRKDNNLYLYLLSCITECPEEYLKKVKELKPTDLILVDTYLNQIENEVRRAIIQDKFQYAYQIINKTISRDEEYSVKFELIRTLLIRAIKRQKEYKTNLSSLILFEEYEELISTLNDKEEHSHLSKTETYILLIAQAIVYIKNTKNIPVKITTTSYNIYDALLANDFETAMKINEEFLEHRKENKETDLIHILLTKLNQLISETEKTQNIHIESSETNTKTTSSEAKEFVPSISQEVLPPAEEYPTETNELVSENKKIKDAEEFANYVRSQNIPLEAGIKRFGFLPEQALLIKLIYARDYYIESNYPMGDKLLQEVKNSFNKTGTVIALLNEIKANKDNYKKQHILHTRKR